MIINQLVFSAKETREANTKNFIFSEKKIPNEIIREKIKVHKAAQIQYLFFIETLTCDIMRNSEFVFNVWVFKFYLI